MPFFPLKNLEQVIYIKAPLYEVYILVQENPQIAKTSSHGFFSTNTFSELRV